MGAVANAGLALLAAAVVAGCAMPGGGGLSASPAATPCNGPDMGVTINQVDPATKTINVDPDPRVIPKSAAGLRWMLAGNDLSFTDDGISFTKGNYPNQPPSGPLAWGPDGGGRQYIVCFGDTNALGNASWQYTITFRSAAGKTWECDPTVRNFGSGMNARATVSCRVTP